MNIAFTEMDAEGLQGDALVIPVNRSFRMADDIRNKLMKRRPTLLMAIDAARVKSGRKIGFHGDILRIKDTAGFRFLYFIVVPEAIYLPTAQVLINALEGLVRDCAFKDKVSLCFLPWSDTVAELENQIGVLVQLATYSTVRGRLCLDAQKPVRAVNLEAMALLGMNCLCP